MTKRFLGAINGGETLDDLTAHIFVPQNGGVQPDPVTGGTAPFLRGWRFTPGQGNPWYQTLFESRTGDKYWLYFTIEVTKIDGADSFVVAWSDWNTSSPGLGALRITITSGTPTTSDYKFAIQEYLGFWGTLATSSVVRQVSTNKLCCLWELDVTGKKTTLTVNGSVETGLSALVTTEPPSAPGTPAINVVLVGKGNAQDEFILYELFAEDGATADTPYSYTTANSTVHVYSNVAREDVAGSVWSAVNPDPVCPTLLWKCIDDCEDSADIANDYITVNSNGTNLDQQFELNDQDGSATVLGVVLIQSAVLGGSTTLEKFLAHCPTEGGSPVVYTPLGVGPSGGKYSFLRLTPGSLAWSLSKFNELRVGVRESRAAGVAARIGMLDILTIGTNQVQPTAATACVATFVPRVVIF